VLLWWFLGAVALCFGLLFVPIDLSVAATSRREVRVGGRWLFGIVRFQGGESAARRRVRREPRRGKKRGRKPTSPRRALGVGRRMMAIEGLLPGVLRLIRDLVQSVRWRRGSLSLRIGLGDPADTGELCGVVWGAMACLPDPRIQIVFEPDFYEACFEAEAEVVCRITPARMVGRLLRFAVSRPARRAIGVMVWARAA
jgi:hypothetical protein